METLDKAQKLADRSGSLFSKTTLSEAEKLIEQKGSFQEIEKQSQEIGQAVDRLDKAHAAARAVLEAITGPSQAERGTRSRHQARFAHHALPGQPRVAQRGNRPGRRMVADPLGTQVVLEDLRAKSDCLLARIETCRCDLHGCERRENDARDHSKASGGASCSGLKLRESGGNPDASLSQARRRRPKSSQP